MIYLKKMNELKKLDGKLWSCWEEMIRNSKSDPGANASKTKCSSFDTTSCARLPRKDIVIYGLCPKTDRFELVLCRICGKKLKFPAFPEHLRLRHRVSDCGKSPRKSNISEKINTKNKNMNIRKKTIIPLCDLSTQGTTIVESNVKVDSIVAVDEMEAFSLEAETVDNFIPIDLFDFENHSNIEESSLLNTGEISISENNAVNEFSFGESLVTLSISLFKKMIGQDEVINHELEPFGKLSPLSCSSTQSTYTMKSSSASLNLNGNISDYQTSSTVNEKASSPNIQCTVVDQDEETLCNGSLNNILHLLDLKEIVNEESETVIEIPAEKSYTCIETIDLRDDNNSDDNTNNATSKCDKCGLNFRELKSSINNSGTPATSLSEDSFSNICEKEVCIALGFCTLGCQYSASDDETDTENDKVQEYPVKISLPCRCHSGPPPPPRPPPTPYPFIIRPLRDVYTSFKAKITKRKSVRPWLGVLLASEEYVRIVEKYRKSEAQFRTLSKEEVEKLKASFFRMQQTARYRYRELLTFNHTRGLAKFFPNIKGKHDLTKFCNMVHRRKMRERNQKVRVLSSDEEIDDDYPFKVAFKETRDSSKKSVKMTRGQLRKIAELLLPHCKKSDHCHLTVTLSRPINEEIKKELFKKFNRNGTKQAKVTEIPNDIPIPEIKKEDPPVVEDLPIIKVEKDIIAITTSPPHNNKDDPPTEPIKNHTRRHRKKTMFQYIAASTPLPIVLQQITNFEQLHMKHMQKYQIINSALLPANGLYYFHEATSPAVNGIEDR